MEQETLIYNGSNHYQEIYEDLSGDIKNVDIASEWASEKTPEAETVEEVLHEIFPHLHLRVQGDSLYILTTENNKDVLDAVSEFLTWYAENN